jgi:hypothetical protein
LLAALTCGHWIPPGLTAAYCLRSVATFWVVEMWMKVRFLMGRPRITDSRSS